MYRINKIKDLNSLSGDAGNQYKKLSLQIFLVMILMV